MRFNKNREDDPTISMAPLIDIVFLLLIFFMVTSQFDLASGIPINLPNISEGISDEDEKESITLAIDNSSSIFFEDELIEQERLKELLLGLVAEKGELNLILEADREVPHGEVVKIMDLAQGSGIRSIVIAARWKSEALI